MKTVKTTVKMVLATTVIIAVGASAAHAQSSSGGSGTGGGDLQCDAKIQSIAVNIQDWVQHQGDRSGAAPLNLSSSRHPVTGLPYTPTQYEVAISNLLRKPVYANCVGAGDSGYPVQVGNSAKICKTSVDASGINILCDRSLFMSLDETLKIEQIHHELAINIRGLEPDYGSLSTYKISTQLSAFAQIVEELKLVVLPALEAGIGNSKFYIGVANLPVVTVNQYDAGAYCRSLGYRLPTVRELALWATQYGASISEYPRNGFNEVDGSDEVGHPDKFYFSTQNYYAPSENLVNDDFWSSSLRSDDPAAGDFHLAYALSVDNGWIRPAVRGEGTSADVHGLKDPVGRTVLCVRSR